MSSGLVMGMPNVERNNIVLWISNPCIYFIAPEPGVK